MKNTILKMHVISHATRRYETVTVRVKATAYQTEEEVKASMMATFPSMFVNFIYPGQPGYE